MNTQKPSERNWILVILLYLCILYVPYIISRIIAGEQFMKGDCYYYEAVIVSLVEDGDLVIENNVPDPLVGQLSIGRDGLVSAHPILLSVVSLPFYLLFGRPGLLLFNILGSMLNIVLIFKLNRLFHNQIVSFIVAILYATGALFLDYVYNYSPDVFSNVLFLGGLYLIFREKFHVGVLLLGLAVFARLPNAALAGITLLYIGYTVLIRNTSDPAQPIAKRLVFLVTIGVAFLVSLVPFALSNYLQFGSPFMTGYQQRVTRGADGQMLIIDQFNMFNEPLLRGIAQVLLDPGNGILLTNPVLFLAFAGMVSLKKLKHPDWVYTILLICVIQFLIIAKYDEWFTSHFSNRFLMILVALSSVFTGNFLSTFAPGYSLEKAG